MSNAKTPRLDLAYDRQAGDILQPDDNNRLALYLENTVANVLLSALVDDGIITRETPSATIDETTGWVTKPPLNEPILGLVNGKAIVMTRGLEAVGEVQTGTTTTIVDSGLDGELNFWVDGFVVFTSGDQEGEVRRITGYSPTHSQLSWDSPLPDAPDPGDDYIVTFFYVQDYTPDATNYVFGVETTDTAKHGRVEWEARTSPEKDGGDILIAKVVTGPDGLPVSVDNQPNGADRTLWSGMGGWETVVCSFNITWDEIAGPGVRVRLHHTNFLIRGSTEITLSDDDCFAVVADGTNPNTTVIDIARASGTDPVVTVGVSVTGRRKIYL